MTSLPLLALTAGDPAGIGPEITALALASEEVRRAARVLVLGPAACRPAAVPEVLGPDRVESAGWLATDGPKSWAMGEVQESCGAAALAALRAGHELALAGSVDALVTGPVNKAALHAAGARVEGQTQLLAEWCGVTRYEMIGLAGKLRVMLLTRHLPLREALARIDVDGVREHLVLFAEALEGLGVAHPRLVVAGLNPHAGEGGILGREEIEILAPAIEAARGAGVSVEGPVSPDTVFLDAFRGKWDGVLALYHDQAFIPLKLLGDGRGVTYIAGLPYLRFSPMHGTAFDIAGRGGADPTNLIEALIHGASARR